MGCGTTLIELHNIFTSKPDFVKPQFVRDNGFTTRNSKPADSRTDKFAVAAVAKPFTQKKIRSFLQNPKDSLGHQKKGGDKNTVHATARNTT